jgi:hypothetical protein
MTNTVAILESGTSATQDMSFYTLSSVSATVTITSSTQSLAGSGRSLAFNTSTTAGVAGSNYLGNGGTGAANTYLVATGSRCSFYYRFTTLSASKHIIISVQSGAASAFRIALNSSGNLAIYTGTTLLATGTSTLSINTDYRISFYVTVTSTTVNFMQVFLNGTAEVSCTNQTIAVSTIQNLQFGSPSSGWAISSSFYYAHIYVDTGSATTDTGDIRITYKRPYSSGTTNAYSTSTGAGSGYGTGFAPWVNEQPNSSSDCRTTSMTSSAITEEYNIEGITAGATDLTGSTIVGQMGWLWGYSGTSALYTTILSGATTTALANWTTTNGLIFAVNSSSTYPAGTGTDIGVKTATSAGYSTKLFGAGILFAYLPVTTHLQQTRGYSTDLIRVKEITVGRSASYNASGIQSRGYSKDYVRGKLRTPEYMKSYTNAALKVKSRSNSYTRAKQITGSLEKSLVRLALVTKAIATDIVTRAIITVSRTKAYVRSKTKMGGVEKSYTRGKLAEAAQSKSYTRGVARALGRAKSYTKTKLLSGSVVTDKISVTTIPYKLTGIVSYIVKQVAGVLAFRTAANRVPVIVNVIKKVQPVGYTGAVTPYTTIQSQVTLSDQSSNPINGLLSATVVVSGPYNTSTTYTLAASQVVLQGAGVWQIQYNTGPEGNYVELWSVTTASGSIAEFRSSYTVSLSG